MRQDGEAAGGSAVQPAPVRQALEPVTDTVSTCPGPVPAYVPSASNRRDFRQAAGAGSGSSFFLSCITYMSMVRSDEEVSHPWVRSRSCLRVKTRPGSAAMAASTTNSPASTDHRAARGGQHLVLERVHRQGAHPQNAVVRQCRVFHPAQQRTDSGHQLARTVGLGHVVVGAEVETEQQVVLVGPRGQHQDPHDRLLTQDPANVVAVDLRHHHVQQQQVGAQLHSASIAAAARLASQPATPSGNLFHIFRKGALFIAWSYVVIPTT